MPIRDFNGAEVCLLFSGNGAFGILCNVIWKALLMCSLEAQEFVCCLEFIPTHSTAQEGRHIYIYIYIHTHVYMYMPAACCLIETEHVKLIPGTPRDK